MIKSPHHEHREKRVIRTELQLFVILITQTSQTVQKKRKPNTVNNRHMLQEEKNIFLMEWLQ